MSQTEGVNKGQEIIQASVRNIIDQSFNYSEGETIDCQLNADEITDRCKQLVKQQQQRKQQLSKHGQELQRLVWSYKMLNELKNQEDNIKEKIKQKQEHLNIRIEELNKFIDHLIDSRSQLLESHQHEHDRDNLMNLYKDLNEINKAQRDVQEKLRENWEQVYENKNIINGINSGIRKLNEQIMQTNINILQKRQRISQIERKAIENSDKYIRCSNYLNRNGLAQFIIQPI